MPRYEFSEGTSNKFWVIELDGKSFTTTYGKIGTTGQTTIKKFKTDAEAKREYEKIIAEKVKKGYELVAGASAKPAAASAGAKPATPGARHFELVEGTSSKFWEIALEGTSVITRYGRIGADGQSTTKELDSKAEAFKEYDKLIAEKTKKGYEEKGGGDGGAVGDARNPDLEAAIEKDPYDKDAYAVYGDWLQGQGDPRGELIALMLAGKDKQAQALIEKQTDYFLGPLAEHQDCYDPGLGNNNSSLRFGYVDGKDKEWEALHAKAFHWKFGFIHWARLSHSSYADGEWEGKLSDVLELLLRHPSGRFLAEMSFCFNGDDNEDDLTDLLEILGKKAPKTLRKIIIGDNIDQISWYHVGNMSKLWKGVPGLASLDIIGGDMNLGTIETPNLRHAMFKSGGLAKAAVKSIATARWPKIEHLDIYFGDENYGGDATIKEVQPLLDRTDLESLAHLGLMNSELPLTEAIVKALPTAKIVRRIKHLDLSCGCLTDELAQQLAGHKDAFAHLDTLDVSETYVTKAGVAALQGCAKKVIANELRDDDDPEYRHPRHSE
jgi:uncharacterized protein (TIGR02996 family)